MPSNASRFRIHHTAKAKVTDGRKPVAFGLSHVGRFLANRATALLLGLVLLFPSLTVGGYFTVTCRSADGSIAWTERVVRNGVSNFACNNILDVYLRNQSQTATWYGGLIDNAAFTALSASDTMTSHVGWTESTCYSNASRPAFTPVAASSGSITNTTTMDFTINAGATLKGVFLASDATKGGTAGNLFATAAFTGGNQTVTSGQTLHVTYTCSATSSS